MRQALRHPVAIGTKQCDECKELEDCVMKPWLLIALKKKLKISKSFTQKMFRDLKERHLLFSAGSDKIKLDILFSAFPNVTTIFLLRCSVQFSHSVVSDSLRPHESQHSRPPCPSPSPGVYPNSCSSSW